MAMRLPSQTANPAGRTFRIVHWRMLQTRQYSPVQTRSLVRCPLLHRCVMPDVSYSSTPVTVAVTGR